MHTSSNVTVMTFRYLQEAQKEWCNYNFPNQTPHAALLGMMEELGELSHAVLKEQQGIRGTPEEHKAAKEDAIGDIVIYMADFCTKHGLDFQKCVEDAWAEVSQRDWIKYPKDGRTA